MSDQQKPSFPPRSERLQQKRQAEKEKKASQKDKDIKQQSNAEEPQLHLRHSLSDLRGPLSQQSLPPLESLLGKSEIEAGQQQTAAGKAKTPKSAASTEPEKPKGRRKWLRMLLIGLLAIVIFLIPSVVLSLWNHLSTSRDPLPNTVDTRPVTQSTGQQQQVSGDDQQQVPASDETDASDEYPVTEDDKPVVAKEDTGRVRLAFVGDVLLGSTVEQVLNQYGTAYPYDLIREALADADWLAANLETPITDGGVKSKQEYAYRSSPDVLPDFKQAGFDLVTLANNHILDYGAEGLLDTLANLNDQGIAYVGAGENAAEAYKPNIQEVNGVKIAFLGFSQIVPDGSWKAEKNRPGVADSYGYDRPLAAIAEAKAEADLVVVMAHWGGVRELKPNSRQQFAARSYIDAGADLVVGSHPHVLQGVERYKDKWIAYSLGNFIFTTNEFPRTWETAILYADCDQEGTCEIEFLPVQTEYAQPKIMNDTQAATVLQRLDSLSNGVEIRADGSVHAEP